MELGAAEIAKLFGITERWVQRLAKEGVFVKVKYGKYDAPKSAQNYLAYKIKTELERKPESDSVATEIEKERLRKMRLSNDEAEQILIATEYAMGAVEHVVGTLRTGLAGVPARVTSDVDLRGKIDNAIDNVLDDLTRGFEEAGAALSEGRNPLEAD